MSIFIKPNLDEQWTALSLIALLRTPANLKIYKDQNISKNEIFYSAVLRNLCIISFLFKIAKKEKINILY